MVGYSNFRRLAGALAITLGMSLAGGVCAAADKMPFDIAAGSAPPQLNTFADQAGLQILCEPYRELSRINTHEVRGEYEPIKALEIMIAGTGIGYKFVNERTIRCWPPGWTEKGPKLARAKISKPSDSKQPEAPLPEVIVTGTHIRGASPVGARRIVIPREQIERSGLATVADVVRTLPQNFEGGPTEDTRVIGRETRTNTGMGTALNLRGIGPGETLVLLDGRRLAPGGSEGAFLDISSIPLTAVEQIDILPDSGSALYGTDAIGGVVNIVLRRKYSGLESQARVGTATQGGPEEYQFGQLIGAERVDGSALLAIEYYQRDALPAAARAQARSDLTPYGGDNFDVPQSNPGTIIAGGLPWAIPSGQDGTQLEPGDFVAGTRNLQGRFEGADINPLQRRWSALGTVHHVVNDDVRVFADALFTRREPKQNSPGVKTTLTIPNTHPYYVNPTGGDEPILMAYDFADDLGPLQATVDIDTLNLASGADIDMRAAWHLLTYIGHARERLEVHQTGQPNIAALTAALSSLDPDKVFNPFGDGSHTHPDVLAGIRGGSLFSSESKLTSIHVTADGPLLRLPTGVVKLAIGADYRRQSFKSALDDSNIPSLSDVDLNRDVTAVFAELFIPLAPSALTVSLAARHEKHSDVGSTTAPKFGLRWTPLEDLTLRGTWTKSFRAPNLSDLYEDDNASAIIPLLDPASPSMVTPTLTWSGRNRNLRPESARSWTFGAEIGPPWLQGWSVALTYFDVRLRNQFTENLLDVDALTNPGLAHLITRNPTEEQRRVVCSRSHFSGIPDDCLNAEIGAIIDARLSNSAFLATSGLDLTARREFDTPLGLFELDLNGAYVWRYSKQETPNTPLLALVNTQNNPLRLRTRTSVSWQRAAFGATAYVNYDGSYRDIASVPRRKVSSWATLDLQLRYDGDDGGWLANTSFSVNAQNLFDEDPPFLNNHLGLGYDAENADLLGRVVSFDIRKKW